jgi:hypothetical protein
VFSRYGWFRLRRTVLEIEGGQRAEGGKHRETPLDEFLGLKGLAFSATAAALERSARWGQELPYQKEEELYKEEFHIEVTDSYLHKLTDYVGGKLLEEDEQGAKEWEVMLERGQGTAEKADRTPGKPRKKGAFYIMIDGSMLNTRDTPRGESSWKEVKLALFFAAKDTKRRKRGNEETVSIKKKDYAVRFGEVKSFGEHLLAAAERNHCFDYEQLVIISDGATWIRQLGKELFPDAVQILDFWHLAENLYAFARFLFHDDESKYKPWARACIERLIERLKEGNAEDRAAVLAELKRYEKRKCPAGVCNAYTYLKNNQKKIRYAEYKAKGWYIGSGPMESSNKTAVQRRMKQSGMRWDTEHARRLLALRIRYDSDRWNEVSYKLAELSA